METHRKQLLLGGSLAVAVTALTVTASARTSFNGANGGY